MKLNFRQLSLARWALDPMSDFWCTDDGAHGRDGPVYLDADLPQLDGRDLELSSVQDINRDLIYRLGTQYPDIADTTAAANCASRLAARIYKTLGYADSTPTPAPHTPTPAPQTPQTDAGNVWTLDDGGRADAGYRGHTGDCLCRAVAIVTGRDYASVYDEINETCKGEYRTKGRRTPSSARTGVYRATAKKYLTGLGFTWTPTMGIGTGCKVHLRADELPQGRILVNVSKHWTALIDGLVHDTYDCTRDGTRCVYGYWTWTQ